MSANDPQYEQWRRLVEEVRAGVGIPFDEQWARFEELAAARPPGRGPMPAWMPHGDDPAATNLAWLIGRAGVDGYPSLHRWSVANREAFWELVVERLGVPFVGPPSRMLDPAGDPLHPRWMPDARLNAADACFVGPDDAPAVLVGRDGSDEILEVTLGQLRRLADRVAHGFAARFEPGDEVALYMPMNLECVAAYLGIVLAGGAVVSIADSFAAEEIVRRLRIAGAKAIVTVDRFRRGGRDIALYDTVCAADGPTAVVLGDPAELRAGDLTWDRFLGADAPFRSVPRTPSDVTNVLFSSGTTGDPKAIPWTHLTPLKAAMDGHFHHDVRPGDVLAWPTNIGWMMGPWLIYAALVNRAAMALYEGLPTGDGFARFVERARVTMLGVVPSLVRAWRDSGAADGADWLHVRVLSSTGEPSNRRDFLWLMSRTGYRAPVIEYCGGTEIGGGYVTGTVVQPASPSTFTTPALGLDMVILGEDGRPVGDGGMGEVFLVPPSIGLSETLLNRDHDEVYHAGCPAGPGGEPLRRHGDQMARLPGGFYRAQGRADDTMNLGGIKVSSRELETVVDRHPEVFEAAAVSFQPEGEGAERLVLFVHLADGSDADPERLRRELGREIAGHLNPLFKVHDVVVVDALPRTASNKLMRRELRRRFLDAPR